MPDIAKIDGRRMTASLTLPDGGTRELQIRLSADGILLIHLPDGRSQVLDERQVVLLALAAAKTNLGASPDAIRTAVIAR